LWIPSVDVIPNIVEIQVALHERTDPQFFMHFLALHKEES
jgi:hypothetical protein